MNDLTDRKEKYAKLLSQVDFFSGLDRVTLAKISGYLEQITVDTEGILFHQGSPGDAFYIVAHGSFGVHVAGHEGAESYRVKTLYPGDPVGEMALLTDQPRTATIQADEPSEVLRLERAKFLELVNKQPSVALSIAATISRRLAAVLTPSTEVKDDQSQEEIPTPEKALVASPPAKKQTNILSWVSHPIAISAIIAAIVFILAWTVPPPTGISATGWYLLATIFAFIPALVLNILPEGVLALLLITVWILVGIVPANVALSGYASPGWILVVTVLIIANTIASSGLLYRLALWVIVKCRGSYTRSIFGLMFTGIAISPMIPNATSRIVFISPVVTEIVEGLGFSPKSRGAAGIAMTALVAFGQLVGMFLTSSTTAFLVYSVLPPSSRAMLTWFSWAEYGLILNLIIVIGLLLSIFYFYKVDKKSVGNYAKKEQALALQRTVLGPISKKEWKAIIISLFLIIGFITEPYHGINLAWISILALACLGATRLMTNETIQSINWSFVLLFGMLCSLSTLFTVTKLDEQLAVIMGATMGKMISSETLFLIVITLICYLTSLLIRWQAAAPLVTITMAPIAAAAGINPLIIGIIAVIACNTFFLPYQSTIYLALYQGTGGQLFTNKQARPMAFAYAVVTLLGVIISVPYWRALGLIN